MECRRGLAIGILSGCPSVKRVHCDKTEESYVLIFISYERTFILVLFSEKENGWWGQSLLLEMLGQPARVGAKSPILNR